MSEIKKTTQLKRLLNSERVEFLMEAHNGLSAKIVQEAGFAAIWGSGLTISASLGVRDNNEASWTQVLEVVEFMSDATDIPILLDGDTGYGNFNNVRRLVQKLEQRCIAGVCIEDKIFPKTNSFLRGEQQDLADINEFCGKIKAAVDSRQDSDFCLVARTEAFIAGLGLDEALKRAEAYQQAGADAILVHSKISTVKEIAEFMKHWSRRTVKCPVVVVPTKYYSTPTEVFQELGISTVIWANHLLRSGVTAMQETAKTIFHTQSLIEIEDKVAPVKELFRLQNDQELLDAEKRYQQFQVLKKPKAIILAASRGSGLEAFTEDRPKALIEVGGKPVAQRMVQALRDKGIGDISLVRGYKKEKFTDAELTYFDNEQFAITGELSSLYMAREKLEGPCLVAYGDILFRKYILTQLVEEADEITIVVDRKIRSRAPEYQGDFVGCTASEDRGFEASSVLLKNCQFGSHQEHGSAQGEWIGLLYSNSEGTKKIASALSRMHESKEFVRQKMPDLLNRLVADGARVTVTYISGCWMDIDSIADLNRGHAFLGKT